MLIYGVYGIFAHKETIKQFLQPMIEKVWERGGCAAFCVSFFQFTDAFFGSILPICIFLLYIMCISLKSQTVFWAQHFRDVQLIPNF